MGIGAVGLLMGKESKLALVCGIVLMGCGVFVYFMRKSHQDQKDQLNARHSQLSKDIQNKKNTL
jgi:hypothetical protein